MHDDGVGDDNGICGASTEKERLWTTWELLDVPFPREILGVGPIIDKKSGSEASARQGLDRLKQTNSLQNMGTQT